MKITLNINRKLAVFGFYFLLLGVVVFFALNSPVKKTQIESDKKSIPEVEQLSGKGKNFAELEEYFKNLAEVKGARYAFEVLREADLGPNIDLHLLGHAVGEKLYKQEGVQGMTACNNDFRNACSHAIVIGLFDEKGEAALSDITEACRKAPGGSGAYTMCFHGLGHGVLAYYNYNMEKAAKVCIKTASEAYFGREADECIGGMVMEIIGGGFHARGFWEKERKLVLNPKNPLSLCQAQYIPERSRFMCYIYLTPYLFEAAGADPAFPKAEDFTKAFKFCKSVPVSDKSSVDACYGGFGKEFVGLVLSRDIRNAAVSSISDQSLKQVYDWCLLAGSKEGTGACIVHALNSMYWGGENDYDPSLRFCSVMQSDEYNNMSCLHALIGAVGYYRPEKRYMEEFCGKVPEKVKSDCFGRISKN